MPTKPGVYMLVRAHDDWCKAPLLDCTCKPDTHYVPVPTRADYDRVARAERDWTAAIRRGLS